MISQYYRICEEITTNRLQITSNYKKIKENKWYSRRLQHNTLKLWKMSRDYKRLQEITNYKKFLLEIKYFEKLLILKENFTLRPCSTSRNF